MPPLQLTDDEMSVLRRLAEPLDQQRRTQFLEEVAAELEAKRQAGEIGEGAVHRVARELQRKFFRPAGLHGRPAASRWAPPGGPLDRSAGAG